MMRNIRYEAQRGKRAAMKQEAALTTQEIEAIIDRYQSKYKYLPIATNGMFDVITTAFYMGYSVGASKH